MAGSDTRAQLLRLIEDSGPETAIGRAKAYGVDLSQLVESLLLSPTERLQKHQRFQALTDEIRRSSTKVLTK